MRSLLLFLPRFLRADALDAGVPALRRLLARARETRLVRQDLEAALLQSFGVQRQRDWPVAPFTWLADGGNAAGLAGDDAGASGCEPIPCICAPSVTRSYWSMQASSKWTVHPPTLWSIASTRTSTPTRCASMHPRRHDGTSASRSYLASRPGHCPQSPDVVSTRCCPMGKTRSRGIGGSTKSRCCSMSIRSTRRGKPRANRASTASGSGAGATCPRGAGRLRLRLGQ